MERKTNALKLWFKQHGANERRLGGAISEYFDSQLSRILAGLHEFPNPTPAIVDQIFRTDDEHAELMAVVRPHLLGSMGMGGSTVLALLDSRKMLDDIPAEYQELPQGMLDSIEGNWLELERQQYWRDIQRTTHNRLADVLGQGITDGVNPRQLSNRLMDAFGGQATRQRANSIARTETTGAMNAGHQVGYDYLASFGAIAGKQWSAILDLDLRNSHLSTHNQIVPAQDNFKIPAPTSSGGGKRRRRRRRKPRGAGGLEEAPWPGYWGLSPGNRINCRCTTLASLNLE